MARSSSSAVTTVSIQSDTATVNYDEFVQDSIVIELGYADEETLVPYDLTGYLFTLEIRANQADLTPLYTLSTAQGTILLNHDIANGYNIKAIVTDTMTNTMGAGIFHYFMKYVDTAGLTNTLVIGTITLKVR